MSDKCPECGYEANPSGWVKCVVCGYSRIPKSITLRWEASGKSLTLRITTRVGGRVLRSLAGEEAHLFGNPQFIVRRDLDAGWFIDPVPGVKNPTCVDGVPLDASRLMTDGMRITLGPDRAALLVELGDLG